MGRRTRQPLDTLSVASSLSLVSIGSSDPTQRVLPLNPELWQTPRQLFLLRLFTVPAEPSCFASSVVTPRGYKAGGSSYATYIFPDDLPPSPRLLPYD
jgi:hypothetical protein